MAVQFEQGPIRPPSEAESLLVRVTRNCPWNRCLFCPVYKGEKFSRRTPEEIKSDIASMREAADKVRSLARQKGTDEKIDQQVLEEVYRRHPRLLQVAIWLFRGGRNVFLQDADSTNLPADQLAEVISFIKEQFPSVDRITTYARSKTVDKRSVSELRRLKEAGLTRVHIGLETGHDPLLDYMQKGVTAEEHISAGLKVKEAGLSLSEYIILGLGGRALSREHALDTARVLSEIDPHYIRVRTLAVRQGIPLLKKVQDGEFELLSDDETAREERLLLQNLSGTGHFVSDHILNLLEEVQGKLPDELPAMLHTIDRYLHLPDAERANFRLGRRLGIYRLLRDMNDKDLFGRVETIQKALQEEGKSEEEFIEQYMGRFI